MNTRSAIVTFLVLFWYSAPILIACEAKDVEDRGGLLLAKIPGPSGLAVAYNAKGTQVMLAGTDGAHVWDLSASRRIGKIMSHGVGVPLSLADFAVEGDAVLTAAGARAILWDVQSAERHRSFSHDAQIRDVALAPDGRRLITAGVDGKANVWDVDTGRLLLVKEHPGELYSVEFVGRGETVMTVARASDRDGFRVTEGDAGNLAHEPAKVFIWNVGDGKNQVRPSSVSRRYDPERFSGVEWWIRPAAVDADGLRFARYVLPDGLTVQSSPDPVIRRAPLFAKVQARYDDGREGTGLIGWIEFISKDLVLVCGGTAGPSLIKMPRRGYDATPKGSDWVAEEAEKLTWHADVAEPSRDGRRVLARSARGVASVFDNSGRGPELLRVIKPNGGMPAAAFSPDGRDVAIGFADDELTAIWHVAVAASESTEPSH